MLTPSTTRRHLTALERSPFCLHASTKEWTRPTRERQPNATLDACPWGYEQVCGSHRERRGGTQKQDGSSGCLLIAEMFVLAADVSRVASSTAQFSQLQSCTRPPLEEDLLWHRRVVLRPQHAAEHGPLCRGPRAAVPSLQQSHLEPACRSAEPSHALSSAGDHLLHLQLIQASDPGAAARATWVAKQRRVTSISFAEPLQHQAQSVDQQRSRALSCSVRGHALATIRANSHFLSLFVAAPIPPPVTQSGQKDA